MGSLFFLIQRNWLIIYWALGASEEGKTLMQPKKDIVLRKKVKLYCWKDELVFVENVTLIWFCDKADNIKHLVNYWLSFLYEERILDRRVNVESVGLSEFKQEVYLSFDQFPFNREWSIYKKWRLIEALNQTISHASMGIKSMVYLVAHQPMVDEHLDFSLAWPIDSFSLDAGVIF